MQLFRLFWSLWNALKKYKPAFLFLLVGLNCTRQDQPSTEKYLNPKTIAYLIWQVWYRLQAIDTQESQSQVEMSRRWGFTPSGSTPSSLIGLTLSIHQAHAWESVCSSLASGFWVETETNIHPMFLRLRRWDTSQALKLWLECQTIMVLHFREV